MRLIDAMGLGAMFAGSVLVGLFLGALVASRTGSSLWVVGGLFAGFVIGGAAAFTRIIRFLK
jgi:hypothetical protein